MKCDTASKWLEAYLDGELDAVRSVELEEHLAGCASCSAGLAELRRLSGIVKEQVQPSELSGGKRVAILSGLPRKRERRIWLPAAAGFAVGCLVMLALWRPWMADGSIARALVADHIRSLMAQGAIQVVSSDQHTVKPWFQGKLSFSPSVVDLSSQGFPLLGGRLDYVEGRPVAALVYRRRQHFVNVFVGVGLSGSSADVDGFHTRHWTMGGLDYWAVTDASPADLEELQTDFEKAAGE